jgi:oligopeptide/dipeptide ABC transporter ATP-binding protein
MYGGRIQEIGTVLQLFETPRHPYTKGLLASLPAAHSSKKERLYSIPGNVPALVDMPAGCKFCTRCEQVMDRCQTEEPPLYDLGDGHYARCHLFEEDARGGTHRDTQRGDG